MAKFAGQVPLILKLNNSDSLAKMDQPISAITGSVDEARAEFLNYAEAYAIGSGKCACCGRTLTVPASVHRGLGPDCAKKYGF